MMPPFEGGAKAENKLSYVAPPLHIWDWYVGTGIYLTDIEAAYEDRLLSIFEFAKQEVILVIAALFILLIFGALAFFMFSNKLQKLVEIYSNEINSKNDELKELNLSLEEKVLEKTAELNELNRILEQRIEEEVARIERKTG